MRRRRRLENDRRLGLKPRLAIVQSRPREKETRRLTSAAHRPRSLTLQEDDHLHPGKFPRASPKTWRKCVAADGAFPGMTPASILKTQLPIVFTAARFAPGARNARTADDQVGRRPVASADSWRQCRDVLADGTEDRNSFNRGEGASEIHQNNSGRPGTYQPVGG